MDKKGHFQFYETFFENLNSLDDATQLKFYQALAKYGLYEIEPEFSGLEAIVWQQFKFSIDNQKARRIAHIGNKNASKNKSDEQTKTKVDEFVLEKTNKNKNDGFCSEINKPLHEEEKEDEWEEEVEGEEEYEEEKETEQEKQSEECFDFSEPNSTHRFSPEQEKRLFDVWNNAGLPCNRGNFISFQQGDLKESLQYIRNKPPEDVIQAARNFVSVIKSPNVSDIWKNKRPTFDAFCSWKSFKQFLPDNFSIGQHLKPDKEVPLGKMDSKQAESVLFGKSMPHIKVTDLESEDIDFILGG